MLVYCWLSDLTEEWTSVYSSKGQCVNLCLKNYFVSLLVFQEVTMAGDGYRGRMSPHTPNEKFEGATVLKTLQVHQPLKHHCMMYKVHICSK